MERYSIVLAVNTEPVVVVSGIGEIPSGDV